MICIIYIIYIILFYTYSNWISFLTCCKLEVVTHSVSRVPSKVDEDGWMDIVLLFLILKARFLLMNGLIFLLTVKS
jgi:hypothetical protein